jgi:hypothetical protein
MGRGKIPGIAKMAIVLLKCWSSHCSNKITMSLNIATPDPLNIYQFNFTRLAAATKSQASIRRWSGVVTLKAETIGTVFIRRQMLAVSFKYSHSSTEV